MSVNSNHHEESHVDPLRAVHTSVVKGLFGAQIYTFSPILVQIHDLLACENSRLVRRLSGALKAARCEAAVFAG